MFERDRKRRVILWTAVILGILLCLAGAAWFLHERYTIKTVYVEGNVHYSQDEIMNIVMDGTFGSNSLYLSMKYKKKGIENVPFVDTMDVTILSPDTIKITVYEKALAGYVEYLGRYMYFDKDGTVVESSDVKTAGIPQITGLNFEYVVLAKALPIENEAIFKQILNVTQLLGKYGLSADKIHFGMDYHMTIFFGGVKVAVGSEEGLDEKVMVLPKLLPSLEGKKGILRMENYSESAPNITFEPEKNTESDAGM